MVRWIFNGWKSTNRVRRIAKITALSSLAVLGGCGCGMLLLSSNPLQAFSLCAEPPHYPWSHDGTFATLDHASVRRGYQVYKEVCCACHSLKRIAFRHLVHVSHTTKQAKLEAADAQIEDCPDEQGNTYLRSGKLVDKLPIPYKNDQLAKLANNGAIPPDLSFIALAREKGLNYIFSLLTGYEEAPEGVKLDDGLHYNPFMSGGKISMQAPLYDDIIEYEDGTPATLSQLAKDVSTFLMWTSQMEHDERKFLALKSALVLPFLVLIAAHVKRVKWSSIKNRKLQFFRPPPKYYD